MGVRCLRVLFLDGGDFGSQTFQFGIESGLTRQQFGEFGVFFRKLRFKLLKLGQRLRRNRRCLGQQQRIKRQAIRWLAGLAIGACQPEADMKQLAHCGHRVQLLQGPVAVRGQIPQILDQLCLDEDFLPDCGFETRLVDERAEIVLIGQLERRVAFVEPRHS